MALWTRLTDMCTEYVDICLTVDLPLHNRQHNTAAVPAYTQVKYGVGGQMALTKEPIVWDSVGLYLVDKRAWRKLMAEFWYSL